MKTYFIRHTKVLDVDDPTFNLLLEKNLIAIHFPYLESEDEECDTDSLNPDDYKKSHWKKSIKCLLELAEKGGYVCAEFRSVQGAVIGFVPPGSKIEILEGTWGSRNNRQGREAKLKTLSLSKVKPINTSDYLIISSGRPRQGTISIWNNVSKRIECLVENKFLEPILGNLSPTQQEVMCSEFLRSKLDENILPNVISFLLPVGRTLLDVDIIGINVKKEKIYAQVTYSSFKNSKTKFENLKKYTSKDVKTIFFCNYPKPEIIDGVIVYPLQLVFDKFSETEDGRAWLEEVFK